MTIRISAFAWVPDFARGQVRDLRVRWALEEADLPYGTRLLRQGDQDTPEYRALQPFGQVPIFEEDGFVLFETGAIVLHIGGRCEELLPSEPEARARATQWVIAALNSIEPFAMQVALIDIFYKDEAWAKLRRPGATDFVRRRLGGLANALGGKAYLDGDRFTAGDLMMSSVLRVLDHTPSWPSTPTLPPTRHAARAGRRSGGRWPRSSPTSRSGTLPDADGAKRAFPGSRLAGRGLRARRRRDLSAMGERVDGLRAFPDRS